MGGGAGVTEKNEMFDIGGAVRTREKNANVISKSIVYELLVHHCPPDPGNWVGITFRSVHGSS